MTDSTDPQRKKVRYRCLVKNVDVFVPDLLSLLLISLRTLPGKLRQNEERATS